MILRTLIVFTLLQNLWQSGNASITRHPNLMWEAGEAFEEYSIEISLDKSFEEVLDRDRISNVARYVPSEALDPGEYFWRVKDDSKVIKNGHFTISVPAYKIRIHKGSGMDEIRNAMKEAKDKESTVIQFDKATYHLYPGALNYVFEISGIENLIIDGNGSKLVIHDIAGVAKVNGSKHISICNFTIDYATALYTAAKVESVSKDGTLRLSLLEGCVPPESIERFMEEKQGLFIDPIYPRMAEDVRILVAMEEPWERIGEGKYKLKADIPNFIRNVKPGYIYVCAPRHGVQGFQLNDSDDVALVDVTTYYLPGIGVATHYVNDLKLIRLKMLRREDRLLGLQNGGTNIHSARVGPWVEGCVYENPGDDCNHVSSAALVVSEQPAPDQLIFLPQKQGSRLLSPDLDMQTGDTLAFFDRLQGRLVTEAKVLSSSLLENNRVHVKLDQSVPELILKEPGHIKSNLVWTQVYNLSRSCGNFVFRNNRFVRGRRIGILAKSGPGLIENNEFIELGAGGVNLWNAPTEGLYAHEILIQKNHFEGGGLVDRKAGYASAIWSDIFAGKPSEPLHRNIRIVDNTIVDYPAEGMILVDVSGLEIERNQITRTDRNLVKKPEAETIVIENAFDVRIDENSSNY